MKKKILFILMLFLSLNLFAQNYSIEELDFETKIALGLTDYKYILTHTNYPNIILLTDSFMIYNERTEEQTVALRIKSAKNQAEKGKLSAIMTDDGKIIIFNNVREKYKKALEITGTLLEGVGKGLAGN